ncbi:MAG: UDP-N-acetylmuramate dehydrogenase [Spirochaetales bacterium]|nr:UDP-N-acetylmuramate dehydrogenase [Spirochaetales bacterium]
MHFRGAVLFDEPMDAHTSFRVGGPADVLLKPACSDDVAAVMKFGRRHPVFILGAGANILVSDRGIRGIVLDMSGFDSCTVTGTDIVAGAGAAVSDVSEIAARNGLSGLEFIYAMPGSVGGSVWMNARCYGKSVSDIIDSVEIIDEDGQSRRIVPSPSEFSYKVSPFQRKRWAITCARFKLQEGDKQEILKEMDEHRRDRESKGHFAAPSAGSIFKNDRRFGMPSGKIIDSLSLKGTAVGGAQVSPVHANIIINNGGATAEEIFELIRLIEKRVRDTYGFELEREVLLVGDWEKEADR